MRHDAKYTVLFAGAVCVICAILVSSAAVSLEDRQTENARLDRQRNVLMAAGLVTPQENLGAEEIRQRFAAIVPVVVELDTGEEVAGAVDPATYDQQRAKNDPAMSREAPPNPSVIKRLPRYALVYHVLDESEHVSMIVLPIEGYGLWSTLYGFLALEADTTTVRGITYYQHGETPGLGGEVDNLSWKALWTGRQVFDENWQPAIQVIKGRAGPPSEDPHHVDGLSGATITSRGVTNMMNFWLGENGFGPYLENFRREHASS
jgi:Na+-transporting NADH:ubiquinone oxidoreductase subunit C